MFLERFSEPDREDLPDAIPAIQQLKQLEDETLMAYYRRAQELLVRAGGRDRSNKDDSLDGAAQSLLSITISHFIRGIYQPQLMLKSLDYEGSHAKSLRGALDFAEAAKRRIQIEEETIEKLKQAKKNELLSDLSNALIKGPNDRWKLPESAYHLFSEVQRLQARQEDPLERLRLKDTNVVGTVANASLPATRVEPVNLNLTINGQALDVLAQASGFNLRPKGYKASQETGSYQAQAGTH